MQLCDPIYAPPPYKVRYSIKHLAGATAVVGSSATQTDHIRANKTCETSHNGLRGPANTIRDVDSLGCALESSWQDGRAVTPLRSSGLKPGLRLLGRRLLGEILGGRKNT